MLTHTEENYLKSIYHLYQYSQESVSTNAIAGHLKTTAASVTDMMKKLSVKNLIHYEKYKGAKLTASGYTIATGLIRRHRLWETFLVKKLAFSWEEVHDLAEELEHIKSEKLIDRLDAYLDFPKYDPHGDPIPNAEGKFTLRDQVSLDTLEQKEKGKLVGVKQHDTKFLKYLNDLGLSLGTHIQVIHINTYDHSLQISTGKRQTHVISRHVCQHLLVKKMKNHDA